MPTLAGSLIAAVVVAAVPTVKLPWFEFHDYPLKAFERHAEGVTRFQLLIAPDGHVADCTVTQSSGDRDLDSTTCKLASFRARFRPAFGPEGQPAYGLYRSQAVWRIPTDTIDGRHHAEQADLGKYEPGPDLDVSINKFPEGTNEPPVVKLAYFVDAQGHPSSCTKLAGAPYQPRPLVELGCRELLSHVAPAPARTPQGQPIPTVRTGAVEFTTGAVASR